MITFRPLAEADFATLAGWFAREHVQAWWRDPGTPDAVPEKYLPRVRGTFPTEVFVIEHHGRDVGLIQRYLVADHPDHRRALTPTGVELRRAASIDYLIGEPNLVGRGIGSAAIAAFTDLLFDELDAVELIAVTPQADNAASCRALEKAGYDRAWVGMLDSDDPSDAGEAALYLRRRPGT